MTAGRRLWRDHGLGTIREPQVGSSFVRYRVHRVITTDGVTIWRRTDVFIARDRYALPRSRHGVHVSGAAPSGSALQVGSAATLAAAVAIAVEHVTDPEPVATLADLDR